MEAFCLNHVVVPIGDYDSKPWCNVKVRVYLSDMTTGVTVKGTYTVSRKIEVTPGTKE